MPRPSAHARYNAAERYVRPNVVNRNIKSNLGPVKLSALTRKNNALARERANAARRANNNNNNNSVVLLENPAVSAARVAEEEEFSNNNDYGGASFAKVYEGTHGRPRAVRSASPQVPGGLNLFQSSALQKLKARATRGHKAALTAYNEDGVNAGTGGVSAPLPSVVAVSRGASSDPRAVSGQRAGARKTRRRRI